MVLAFLYLLQKDFVAKTDSRFQTGIHSHSWRADVRSHTWLVVDRLFDDVVLISHSLGVLWRRIRAPHTAIQAGFRIHLISIAQSF